MKKYIKNIKAITLIALIVTIIILLVLAGVSIAMINGENGILFKANLAKKDSSEAQDLENNQLDRYNEILGSYTTRNGDVTVSQDTMNSILSRLDVLENKVNNKGKAYLLGDTGGTAISTTSTTFVPYGTSQTFTSNGGDLLVNVVLPLYKPSGWSWILGVRIDSTDYTMSWGNNSTMQVISADKTISGVSAGNHTIQIVYSSNSASSASIVPVYMAYGFNLVEL